MLFGSGRASTGIVGSSSTCTHSRRLPLSPPAPVAPGQPAFGPDGKLLGLHDTLQGHAQRAEILAEYAVNRT